MVFFHAHWGSSSSSLLDEHELVANGRQEETKQTTVEGAMAEKVACVCKHTEKRVISKNGFSSFSKGDVRVYPKLFFLPWNSAKILPPPYTVVWCTLRVIEGLHRDGTRSRGTLLTRWSD